MRCAALFLLKALALELQCSAVFRNGADDIIRHAARNVCLDFHRDGNLAIRQAGEMLENLIGNRSHIPADALGINLHAAEEMRWW